MRFRIVPFAIRMLPLLVVLAGSPPMANSQERAAPPPAKQVIPPAKQVTPKDRQAGKPDARRPEGRQLGRKSRKAKGQPADPKLHAVPPPAVAAPVPPKPAVKPGKDPNDPASKLPRFAAFKTDETNMRVGPGQRYPIEWVYKRRDLPVEVEKEYDVWRYVRDPEGVRGWVHQVTLSERRTFLVKDTDATIRSAANDTARAVALLRAGVIGRLRSCDEGSKWCQVQVGTFRGYLRRDQFWGLLPNEVVTPS